MQFSLPLWPEANPNHPVPAPAPIVPGRRILPAWYDDPVPDDDEMECRAAERDEALAAYQQAMADYTEAHPPPMPRTFANWREGLAWEKRKQAAIAPALDRLHTAREQLARGNCLRALAEDAERKRGDTDADR